MVAIPRHQTKRAMRNSKGALHMLRMSNIANTLVRSVNNFSIVLSGIAFPRRTSHKCCAKQVPTLAVSAALNIVVKRKEIAEV
jgi:hypothetical protein